MLYLGGIFRVSSAFLHTNGQDLVFIHTFIASLIGGGLSTSGKWIKRKLGPIYFV